MGHAPRHLRIIFIARVPLFFTVLALKMQVNGLKMEGVVGCYEDAQEGSAIRLGGWPRMEERGIDKMP